MVGAKRQERGAKTISALPVIEPMPPMADCVLPWEGTVDDTVAAIAGARAECGDTFAVDSGQDRYLFLFSPEGLRAFYAVPERQASKGVADVKMLLRKLPEELFYGRRMTPLELFDRLSVSDFLGTLDETISRHVSVLTSGDEVELFEFSRRLAHALGLASWGGREILDSDDFDALVGALDALDGAEAFVAPNRMRDVASSGKSAERSAMAQAEQILSRSVQNRRSPQGDLVDEIVSLWDDTAEPEKWIGVARDIILLQLASMSNLFAALGWTLVHLAQHTGVLERVREGDGDLASHCVLESIRIAQRSIMLRTVLEPVDMFDGAQVYRVAPGATLATFLPLTNLVGADDLELYDPDRWRGFRLASPPDLPPEAVTTFGHGPHSCPARPFAIAAIVGVVERLVREFDLEPRFTKASAPPQQIGGVARSAAPCLVVVRAR